MIDKLQQQLDSFDITERKRALAELWALVRAGRIELPPAGCDVNLHLHSFYSYNACGYSPSKIAWLGRKTGLAVAGIVDFDVLDGLEEFLESAGLIELKGCVGIESRVFVPEFADKEINSPGEPGISYHMGIGLTDADVPENMKSFKKTLRKIPEQRNRMLVEKVNEFLSPLRLDYEKDVCSLTPSGNATERHICLAYAKKAAQIFDSKSRLKKFWREKLASENFELPEGADLQALIRAKTMKLGGVGYVQPDRDAFPEMAKMNEFVITCGGIPALTWLNGLSDGEKQIEELIEIAMASGVEAVNIIPDRNFTPGVKDEKLANLNHMVSLAERLDLPISVGTEMNSPGLKFVDDFASAELAPLAGVFLKGAHIIYGHSVMQKYCGKGYTGEWAAKNFKNRATKNEFFRNLGSNLKVSRQERLSEFRDSNEVTPLRILETIEKK